jgi:hypothetical protein
LYLFLSRRQHDTPLHALNARVGTMKVLIHSLESGLYLAEENRWVKSISEAKDFRQASPAITHVISQGFTHVELTYAFASNEYNISIVLDPINSPPKEGRA